VTQQFNTTSSMGRLTLNVLLSFAQFEREVAGERSRADGPTSAAASVSRPPELVTPESANRDRPPERARFAAQGRLSLTLQGRRLGKAAQHRQFPALRHAGAGADPEHRTEWLAFLETVRTERFGEVLAAGAWPLLRAE